MKRFCILIISFLLCSFLFADNSTGSNEKPPKQAVEYSLSVSFDEFDTNSDGLIDTVIHYDSEGRKIIEEIDFNYDEKMDDFYFFRSEVMVRREIDSNYDNKIDIWVYITEGVYISRYERDTDFDGIADTFKTYGE